jgi:hypothetical protein
MGQTFAIDSTTRRLPRRSKKTNALKEMFCPLLLLSAHHHGRGPAFALILRLGDRSEGRTCVSRRKNEYVCGFLAFVYLIQPSFWNLKQILRLCRDTFYFNVQCQKRRIWVL